MHLSSKLVMGEPCISLASLAGRMLTTRSSSNAHKMWRKASYSYDKHTITMNEDGSVCMGRKYGSSPLLMIRAVLVWLAFQNLGQYPSDAEQGSMERTTPPRTTQRSHAF
jgi:hypothetical protein